MYSPPLASTLQLELTYPRRPPRLPQPHDETLNFWTIRRRISILFSFGPGGIKSSPTKNKIFSIGPGDVKPCLTKNNLG